MADEQKNDHVTISKAELQALINQGVKAGLEGLADSQGSNTRILRRVTERQVGIRIVDGKVVLGYKNRGTSDRPLYIYEKPDPNHPKEFILYVDLLLEGGTVLPVEYRQFMREAGLAMCKVVKTEEREWTLNQGLVRKREVEAYSSIELDYEVPLDVVGKVRMLTVQIPAEFGGPREVTIHENYVNIPKA